MDCIFCKIASGEIPSTIVYEDEGILAFNDLSPQAPVHILIIPKAHIASLDDREAVAAHEQTLGHLMAKVHDIAAAQGLDNGYRLVCNCGADGMQTVEHLHFHLLGRRQMGWPPG